MIKINLQKMENESHNEFCARYGKAMYHANKETCKIKSKIKYYKKMYRCNDNFNFLFNELQNENIDIETKFNKILNFHYNQKINKII